MAYWKTNQTCKECDKYKQNNCKGIRLCPFETHDHMECFLKNGDTWETILSKSFAKYYVKLEEKVAP